VTRPGAFDLPHRAYIEALAETPEGSPAWHAIVAGYAALQLFECWLEGDLGATPPSMLEVQRIWRYVEAVPERCVERRCLTQLVDSIELTLAATPHPVAERRANVGRAVECYARLLRYEAQWGLAGDVYSALLDFARATNDTTRMLDAMLMRGYCLRMAGRLDEASAAYAALRCAAEDANDERYRLESWLSDAKVAVERGNYVVARELLDRTLAQARDAECWVVVSKALADRARVAAIQGDLELSLQCSHEALVLNTDPIGRERILGNIALTFARMGLREPARDAGLLVLATAQDRTARLNAMINLMELAHLDARELVFEQYRKSLAREVMTPSLEAACLQVSAEGLRAFGRIAEAKRAAERLLDHATQHSLNEYVIRAAEILEDIEKPSELAPRAERAPQAEPTPSARVANIARAIAEMRVAAGLPA
jgi:tetratricopeptide (TPR) repeat protein